MVGARHARPTQTEQGPQATSRVGLADEHGAKHDVAMTGRTGYKPVLLAAVELILTLAFRLPKYRRSCGNT